VYIGRGAVVCFGLGGVIGSDLETGIGRRAFLRPSPAMSRFTNFLLVLSASYWSLQGIRREVGCAEPLANFLQYICKTHVCTS
jgi:hypothetical protein